MGTRKRRLLQGKLWDHLPKTHVGQRMRSNCPEPRGLWAEKGPPCIPRDFSPWQWRRAALEQEPWGSLLQVGVRRRRAQSPILSHHPYREHVLLRPRTRELEHLLQV